MKNILILLFSLSISLHSFSQDWATNVIGGEGGTTRAIVIGISSYKNFPVDKQLLYADKDAKQFYDFLVSRPDIIKPENIIALFNEDATNKTNILGYLYNFLIKESKPNDLVIIYFAGHGDIQNFNSQIEKGFLLLSNVSSDGDYMAPTNDVISISDLQQYISLVKEGVKVLVITDACRSGKLINSEEGAQKVLTALNAEWQNTFKLVSCQPDQYSFENKKWGGGHGVFSYYLTYGLKGLADENNDNSITFGELYDYIKINVKKDTEYKQIPKAKGDETKTIISVKKEIKTLAETEFKASKDETLLASNENIKRSVSGTSYLSNVNSKLRSDIRTLETEVKKGNLLKPEKEEKISEEKAIEISEANIINIKEKNTFACAIDYEANYGITGGESNNIKIWDLNKRTSSMLKQNGVLCMALSENGDKLYAAGWKNDINIWDLETKELITKLTGHKDDIRSICANNKYIISGGDDTDIRIWNINNNKNISTIKNAHKSRITALEFIDDDKYVSAGLDGRICIRSISENKIIKETNLKNPIKDVCISGNKKLIIVGLKNGKLITIDAKSYNEKNSYIVKDQINALETDFNGRYIFVGGNSYYLYIIDNEKSVIMPNRIGLPKSVSDISLSGNAKKIFVSMYGGKTAFIDLNNINPSNSKSATEVYNKMLSENPNTTIVNRAGIYLVSALNAEIKNTLQPFIDNGTFPELSQIDYALKCSKEAEKITKDDEVFLKQIELNKELLLVLKILAENNFNEYNTAIKKLNSIKTEYPDASYTYNTISTIYTKLFELQKAKENVQVAINNIPDWVEPKVNLGKTLFKEKQYDKAVENFDIVIKKQPELAKGYYNKAIVFSYTGRINEATKLFEKSLKIEPNNNYIIYDYVNHLLNINEITKAEQTTNKLDNSFTKHLLQTEIIEKKITSNNRLSNNQIKTFLEEWFNVINSAEKYDSTNIKLTAERAYFLTTVYAIYDNNKKVDKERMKTLIDKIKTKYQITSSNKKALLSKSKNILKQANSKDPYNLKISSYIAYNSYLYNRSTKKKSSSKKENDKELYKSLKTLSSKNNFAEPLYYYSVFSNNDKLVIKALNEAIKIDNRYYLAYKNLIDLLKKSNKSYSSVVELAKTNMKINNFN